MILLRNIFFFFMLYVILFLVLVSHTSIMDTINRERTDQTKFMGEKMSMAIQIRAENSFTKLFVNSGIMNSTFNMFGQVQTEQSPSNTNTVLEKSFTVIEGKLRATWSMLYQIYLRASYLFAWWPIMLMCLLPTGIDAIARRKAAQYTFASTSPHLQGIALRAIPTILFLYICFMLAPFYMPPVLAPIIVLITAGLSWFAVAHFAKRW